MRDNKGQILQDVIEDFVCESEEQRGPKGEDLRKVDYMGFLHHVN